MTIKVRIARLSDVSGIAQCHVQSWREAYVEHFPADYLASLSVSERESQWTNTIRAVSPFSTEKMVFVAEDEVSRKIIGFTLVGRTRDQDEGADSEVYAIYVLKDFHRNGIGRTLFKTGIEWLQTKGFKKCKLWVLEKNGAREFYEKQGAILLPQVREIEIGGAPVKKISYRIDLQSWGELGALRSARWKLVLLIVPIFLFSGFHGKFWMKDTFGLGFVDEEDHFLLTLPLLLTLPVLWLLLTWTASPRSSLGIGSYAFWRQAGWFTLFLVYAVQLAVHFYPWGEYNNPNIVRYILPIVMIVVWMTILSYTYLIKLFLRRSLYE